MKPALTKKQVTTKCGGCGAIYEADFSRAPALCSNKKCGRLVFGINRGQKPVTKARS